MHPRYNNSMDTEGLQTDVMRFLAIIALCLVAILALVQRAQPPETSQPPQPQKTASVATQDAVLIDDTRPTQPSNEPTPLPAPERLKVIATTKTRAPAEQSGLEERVVPIAAPEPKKFKLPVEPVAATELAATPETVPQSTAFIPAESPSLKVPEADPDWIAEQPSLQQQPAAALENTPRESVTAVAPAAEIQEPTPSPEVAPEEESLSLRFASETDFLRLLTGRTVTLYLFNERSAWRLGRDFAFAESPAPKQVYEVLPSTIPQAILRSAQGKVAGLEHYAWGVGMPAEIEASIQRWVQRVSTGELLIDRTGTVTHVERAHAEG